MRQRLYALSQLWWDSVDPIAYTEDIAPNNLLYQIAMGDEQVPNMTSYTLARSIGMPLVEPAVEPVYGLSTVSTPAVHGLVQLDPGVGPPPDVNRPATDTGAHTRPRIYPGTIDQIVTFLESGQIEATCGASPCSHSNNGG